MPKVKSHVKQKAGSHDMETGLTEEASRDDVFFQVRKMMPSSCYFFLFSTFFLTPLSVWTTILLPSLCVVHSVEAHARTHARTRKHARTHSWGLTLRLQQTEALLSVHGSIMSFTCEKAKQLQSTKDVKPRRESFYHFCIAWFRSDRSVQNTN